MPKDQLRARESSVGDFSKMVKGIEDRRRRCARSSPTEPVEGKSDYEQRWVRVGRLEVRTCSYDENMEI